MRPATVIVRMLQECRSSVYFTYKKERANARSIMSLLMLMAKKNATITVIVDGDDAQQTMDKLQEAFENQFGENK